MQRLRAKGNSMRLGFSTLIVGMATLLSLSAGAQEGQVLTLEQAIAQGVITNPEYGIVANSRRATDEELRQARGLFLPQIDVNADTGFEYTDDTTTRARGDDEELYRNEAGITLTQLLFDGWESHYEVMRQKYRVESSANRVKETSELVGLAIVEAYLEVLRQRELLQITRDNVAEHDSVLQQIQEGVDAGRSTEADLDQAIARLESARATESNTKEALRRAEAEFKAQVGDMPDSLMIPPLPTEYLKDNIEDEVIVIMTQNPTIEIFEADLKVAEAEYDGTKGIFYPQVDLQLNARNGHDINGIQGRDQSASALVTMDWNIYRGGIDSARKREFMHRIGQAKENAVLTQRDVENDARQTWARMIASGERYTSFTNQARANTNVVAAYKDQFNLDRRTLLDVLDSINELFVTRSNAINSKYLQMLAAYRLVALKGQLLPMMNVPYPTEVALTNQ